MILKTISLPYKAGPANCGPTIAINTNAKEQRERIWDLSCVCCLQNFVNKHTTDPENVQGKKKNKKN
jgi:hypothetical protein